MAGPGRGALGARAPRRAMSGWAQVRKGGGLRTPRRWVVLRSGSVFVMEGQGSRVPQIVMPLNGATVFTNPARLEAVVKGADGVKVTFAWPTGDDLNAFKAAFDFANRVLDDRFKTVSQRLLTKRHDSEIGALRVFLLRARGVLLRRARLTGGCLLFSPSFLRTQCSASTRRPASTARSRC